MKSQNITWLGEGRTSITWYWRYRQRQRLFCPWIISISCAREMSQLLRWKVHMQSQFRVAACRWRCHFAFFFFMMLTMTQVKFIFTYDSQFLVCSQWSLPLPLRGAQQYIEPSYCPSDVLVCGRDDRDVIGARGRAETLLWRRFSGEKPEVVVASQSIWTVLIPVQLSVNQKAAPAGAPWTQGGAQQELPQTQFTSLSHSLTVSLSVTHTKIFWPYLEWCNYCIIEEYDPSLLLLSSIFNLEMNWDPQIHRRSSTTKLSIHALSDSWQTEYLVQSIFIQLKKKKSFH